MYYKEIDEYLEIDHKNLIRSDNRICNLRLITKSINQRNINMQKNNTSGFKVVYFDKSRNKWHSEIYINGKRKHLGRFKDKEDAIRCRKEAEKENGYLN